MVRITQKENSLEEAFKQGNRQAKSHEFQLRTNSRTVRNLLKNDFRNKVRIWHNRSGPAYSQKVLDGYEKHVKEHEELNGKPSLITHGPDILAVLKSVLEGGKNKRDELLASQK